jgi:conjugal transfer/entry exclusion protein
VTTENLRGEAQDLKRQIEKVNSEKLALWEKHHAGILSREAFQAASGKLTEQAAACADKIAALEKQIRMLEMESGQENAFAERFSRQTGIQELTRAVIDEFIKSVHVYAPDRIEITLNYDDEYEAILAQTGS